MRRVISTIMLLITLLAILSGCGKESAQEEFYRRSNEANRQAEQIGNKAAEDTRNMDLTVKPVKK
ncbi:MAG: hypothetical protein H6Q76_412 [Firmicutes bacterium]|nr:hypothetical protein [Bacillota bacterium]